MSEIAENILVKRSWLEQVFSDRNKAYGAYYLRMLYAKNVGLAWLYATSVFAGLILAYYFYQVYENNKVEEVVFTAAPVSKKINREKPAEKKKEPIIEPIKEQKIETKEYLSYEPKPDELVKTKLESVDSVLNSQAASISQEGVKDPFADGDFVEPVEQKPVEIVEEEYVELSEIEEWPSFPNGGDEAMAKFMNANQKYPPQAVKMGLEGKVFIQFSIEKDGTLTNIRVARGVDPLLDNEALRLVKMMPKWTPGKLNGKVQKIKAMTIPVSFKLE